MIAIHDRYGSYSDRWLAVCREKNIPHRAVNALATDAIAQIRGAQGFLWQWDSMERDELTAARRVLWAVEAMGVKVFPNHATIWHYDDKVAQKYLLEAIGAPLVPSHAFYHLEDALAWVETATFPKVFKLSRGAGSLNVFLVRDADHARRLCRKAFTSGFKPIAGLTGDLKTRAGKHFRKGDLPAMLRRLPRSLWNVAVYNRTVAREIGFIYFQDFVPDNDCDTRVTVIGDRAFSFQRKVRPNDFRASGSGRIEYDMDKIDPRCLRIAFDTAKKLGTQSLAFDFVRSPAGDPLIVEISYCYLADAVYACPGHWDSTLAWHAGPMWPQDAILLDLLAMHDNAMARAD
jgi:glutathione synthase/RimK-type ligase-like ATP-grasp enzyme